jgi:long-chain acyl-CoA synthetase
MSGYYKNEEATKHVLDEAGWLRTGDLGIIDRDGFLYIKGRSKTMILSGSGQNIYPEEIEDFYNNSPYVSEALIIEENGKLIALIYPDKDYMRKNNIKDSEYSEIFIAEKKAINKRLPGYSQVANFRIQEQEFEKTPKRSIKRFLYQK